MTEPFITLRIPTKDPYAFAELKLEGCTAQEAKELYDEWTQAFTKEPIGLPSREFCSFMDYYVSTGKMPEDGVVKWEAMSAEQRFIIHSIKKCFSRINKK